MSKPDPTVRDGEFPDQVRGMFDRIAGVYDAMNTAMTAGLHHEWRDRTVEAAGVAPGDEVLDICCGTGDLAFASAALTGAQGRVVGCDFSEQMLELARIKAAERGYAASANGKAAVVFEWADALKLPYADASFDVVTVGFGARNLADLSAGLAEMARVLRPGGRLAILEITRPARQPFAALHSLWFERLVPALGRIADRSGAYSYLPESVRTFPDPRALAALIDAAGFREIRWRLMAGGTVAVHSGIRGDVG